MLMRWRGPASMNHIDDPDSERAIRAHIMQKAYYQYANWQYLPSPRRAQSLITLSRLADDTFTTISCTDHSESSGRERFPVPLRHAVVHLMVIGEVLILGIGVRIPIH